MTRQGIAMIAVALPPALVAGFLLRAMPLGWEWGMLGAACLAAGVLGWAIEGRIQTRLRTAASVLAAYREGDYSVRARGAERSSPIREVLVELNQLGDVLRAHRLGELEAWALLRKVMAEVDVVVLAIDDDGAIRLANEAAAQLLGRSSAALVGTRADAVGIGELLLGEAPRIVRLAVEGGLEWELRRGTFRLSGEPQMLLVLSDVSRSLREKEREAWQRLIRVMSHEINNSLSPIVSISESLVSLVEQAERDADWETDLGDGLRIVSRRAGALGRFMNGYARLLRLPPPQRKDVDLARMVREVVALETRVPVEVVAGPDAVVSVDPDQLQQALINLLRNAAEASAETRTEGAGVRVSWTVDDGSATILVDDEGAGVAETANLFVPFFTTKPEGSGIGLVLARQIVEAHLGSLSLATRPEGKGARASVRLRVPAPRSATTPSGR